MNGILQPGLVLQNVVWDNKQKDTDLYQMPGYTSQDPTTIQIFLNYSNKP